MMATLCLLFVISWTVMATLKPKSQIPNAKSQATITPNHGDTENTEFYQGFSPCLRVSVARDRDRMLGFGFWDLPLRIYTLAHEKADFRCRNGPDPLCCELVTS